jgi:hypothetical protein
MTDVVPHTATDTLLARIMRRLGLERQMIRLRRLFGTSIALILFTAAVTVVAVVALQAVLQRSSFLPYAQLIRTDSHFVLRHLSVFVYALCESVPAIFLSAALFSIALVLVCIRLAVVYWDRLSQTEKSIRNN